MSCTVTNFESEEPKTAKSHEKWKGKRKVKQDSENRVTEKWKRKGKRQYRDYMHTITSKEKEKRSTTKGICCFKCLALKFVVVVRSVVSSHTTIQWIQSVLSLK